MRCAAACSDQRTLTACPALARSRPATRAVCVAPGALVEPVDVALRPLAGKLNELSVHVPVGVGGGPDVGTPGHGRPRGLDAREVLDRDIRTIERAGQLPRMVGAGDALERESLERHGFAVEVRSDADGTRGGIGRRGAGRRGVGARGGAGGGRRMRRARGDGRRRARRRRPDRVAAAGDVREIARLGHRAGRVRILRHRGVEGRGERAGGTDVVRGRAVPGITDDLGVDGLGVERRLESIPSVGIAGVGAEIGVVRHSNPRLPRDFRSLDRDVVPPRYW